MKEVIKNFLIFYLKNNKIENQRINIKYLFFRIILIQILFTGIGYLMMFLGVVLLNMFEYPVYVPKTILHSFSNIQLLLIGGLLAPIFEELTFRLPIKLKKINIIISLISLIIIKGFLTKNYSLVNYLNYHSIIIFSYLLIIFLIIYIKNRHNKNYNSLIKWNAILLSFIFAIGHFNGIWNITNVIWIIIITLPQFILALYWSFIRFRYGIKYSIILHIIWNIILLSAKLILK